MEALDPETTELWFAGKKMDRSKCLQDYLGRNEKTKAVVKLQGAGEMKPAREPVNLSMLTLCPHRDEEEINAIPGHVENDAV